MDKFSNHSDENLPTNPLQEIKFDLAHNIIYYKSTQSLQHLAFIRVAISIWQHSQNEMIYFFQANKKVGFSYKVFGEKEVIIRKHWPRIEEKVLKKVPQLNLPPSCKEELNQVIKMVGNEILQFFEFEGKYELLTVSHRKIYLENICWTFQGTVDKAKTALRLIRNPDLSVVGKYIVACNYCLVDDIRTLVQLLPVGISYGFYRKHYLLLPFYWFLHFRGNSPELHEVCSYGSLPRDRYDLLTMLEFALLGNNKVAFQYIWGKLGDQEVKKNVLNYAFMALWRKNCDLVCFLMSQLSKLEVDAVVNIKDEVNIFEMLLNNERLSSMFMPFAKYVCHTIWNFDHDHVEKLLAFCRNIGLKDKRYKNIDVEVSEYCQTHSTGYANKRFKNAK